MTCSFAKEFSTQSITNVENEFITKYMPFASGEAVKVYLYGLFVCAHPELDDTIENIAKTLDISLSNIIDIFTYWEEFGLVSVVSKNPFSVQYLSVKNIQTVKPRKIKAEKYTDFTKCLQSLIPNRMIATSEYTEYFNIMETYNISPDAMIMIAKYCIDKKGDSVSYRYISTVAKDFGNRGIISIEKVENELSTYILHTTEIDKLLKNMSIRRKADIEDLNLYEKWTKTFSFEPENIEFASKISGKNSMKKLDDFITELYSIKCFSKEEIENFTQKKQEIYDLTLKINKTLSVYVEIIDTEIENYTQKWLSFGFDNQTLLFVATECFKRGITKLIDFDEIIDNLRKQGIINLSSVNDYFENEKIADEFIKKILITCGVNRRPTPWDRENLSNWRSWNFSDEMILEAAKLASGKNSAIAYMNGILANWKNKNIFSLTDAENKAENNDNSQEKYNREYERRRTLAVSRAQKNVEKAMEIDGFSRIYERLFGIEKDLAFAEFSNNKEREKELENEKIDLTKKANKILLPLSIDLTDLSPKYACEKCKDTGYVGTHRCDCFEKIVK